MSGTGPSRLLPNSWCAISKSPGNAFVSRLRITSGRPKVAKRGGYPPGAIRTFSDPSWSVTGQSWGACEISLRPGTCNSTCLPTPFVITPRKLIVVTKMPDEVGAERRGSRRAVPPIRAARGSWIGVQSNITASVRGGHNAAAWDALLIAEARATQTGCLVDYPWARSADHDCNGAQCTTPEVGRYRQSVNRGSGPSPAHVSGRTRAAGFWRQTDLTGYRFSRNRKQIVRRRAAGGRHSCGLVALHLESLFPLALSGQVER